MEEIWKSIEGFEGAYEVSNLGRIRSLDRTVNGQFIPGQNMKVHVSSRGYYKLILRAGGVKTTANVHRLVARAFHGPPPEGKNLACHRDGDPLNNVETNLYWGSLSDNMRDSVKHGTHCNTRKTHCKRGHTLPAHNPNGGSRACRECERVRGKQSRDSRRGSEIPSDDPRHGTLTLYNQYLCRCERCRAAVAKNARDLRKAREGLEPGDPRHGTRGGYANYRCRCEPCSEADREYNRLRKLR